MPTREHQLYFRVEITNRAARSLAFIKVNLKLAPLPPPSWQKLFRLPPDITGHQCAESQSPAVRQAEAGLSPSMTSSVSANQSWQSKDHGLLSSTAIQ